MRTLSRALAISVVGLVVLSAAPAARAGVLVVDAAGGGDFTNPNDAIAAAVDGDIILIKAGDYAPPSVFIDSLGKALTIVGDTGTPPVLPPTVVREVPAGKTFVLRHLSFVPNDLTTLPQSTLLVHNSTGRVHIEDCTITGQDGYLLEGFSVDAAKPGLRLFDANGVSVHRCTITGGDAASVPVPGFVNNAGGAAIRQEGSLLALYFVTATAGQGGPGSAPEEFPGQNGGSGLHVTADVQSARIIVVGCTLTGGNGGAGTPAGYGGHGAFTFGPAALLSELDSQFIGGAGSPGLNQVGGGQHDAWPGEAVSLALSAPVRSGEVGSFAVSGPPNKLFGLFFGLGMGYLPKASLHGVFLPAAPFFGPQLVVATNGAGAFNANFTAPSLAAFGLEGLLNVDQVLMVQDAGLVLSSASAYVQVEP